MLKILHACTLSVKSIGTSELSVSSVRVNDTTVAETNLAYGGAFTGTTHTLRPGDSGTITIDRAFSSGTKYEFAVQTATGYQYKYVATAP